MNRIDRAVISGLVVLVAIAALAIGLPALQRTAPARAPAPSSEPSAPPISTYVEGVLSRPIAVNPLASQTEADRDLVALVFEGLVTLDPAGSPRPALARSWTTSADGASWTFQLRPDAHWQDGEPVTADDVAFTIETLQDPDYHGPGAGSWTGITATPVGDGAIRFDLDQPFGGFIDLLTQPIAPQHLLDGIPASALPDDPFGHEPIGSGAYAVTHLDRDHAVLESAASVGPPSGEGSASDAPSADSLATPAPTPRTGVVEPAIDRIELRFFDDPAALADAFRTHAVDAVSGLDPAAAARLADVPGAHLILEPSSTLTAVALNLRPTHPELGDPATRRGLLEALDRSRIRTVAYGDLASAADGLIPPTSWAFDPTAAPPVQRDLKAAAKSLTTAGWTKAKDGWHAPTTTAPTTLELLIPDRSASPVLFAVGSQVAADWRALGFTVNAVEIDPAQLAADRLRTGTFTAAIVQIAVGHDPDLYPLLASTQTQTGGANVFGLQDPTLDDLLEAARRPGADTARKAAFAAVEKRLGDASYILPIAWPDTVVVASNRVQGTANRPVSDGSERFWDVLDWRLADDR
jgi:peptide/nickel transport system substrate-binding protein